MKIPKPTRKSPLEEAKRAKDLAGRRRLNIYKRLSREDSEIGVTLWGEVNREAPVRTEPHPTRAEDVPRQAHQPALSTKEHRLEAYAAWVSGLSSVPQRHPASYYSPTRITA
jgi:hypothetical protein